VFVLLQVKDMAAKTEEIVAVDSLVEQLRKLLSSPPAAAAAAPATSEASS
jgi:hypothetical protein